MSKWVIFYSCPIDLWVDRYQSTRDVEHKHGPTKMLNEVEIIVIELLAAGPSMKYKRNCTT